MENIQKRYIFREIDLFVVTSFFGQDFYKFSGPIWTETNSRKYFNLLCKCTVLDLHYFILCYCPFSGNILPEDIDLGTKYAYQVSSIQTYLEDISGKSENNNGLSFCVKTSNSRLIY